jgi:concentrative nucleoside transporter, CNT family
MDRFIGIIGIVLILGVAFLISNNRKSINYRTVGMGLLLQIVFAVFILKTPLGQAIFAWLGKAVTKVLDFSDKGGEFVFGDLSRPAVLGKVLPSGFIFFFKIIPTIIFVAVLVNVLYHLGIMQLIVRGMAWVMYRVMRVSGAEALSNAASAFVGQVEAQIMVKPYLKGMTKSELMASMTGSFACIAGGVMATYISFGVPAEYLIAASVMAAPGALAIAKIMHPETEESQTTGDVKLAVEKSYVNLVDAIAAGCSDGLRIGLNVIAMLIGFLALIGLLDFGLGKFGGIFGMPDLSFKVILGYLFAGFAWAMGVPAHESMQAGSLMGTKIVVNEFVAYLDLTAIQKSAAPLSAKTMAIVSFALCGFANFSSVAIQIGGISALEPSRRTDLTKLGFRALIAGTLASYLSATIAGILLS